MTFAPRLTAPSGTDKYYISTDKGGYNRCIVINKTTGSVLPNCVGYAYGRFMEEANITSCRLSRANAENWWAYNDGYKRGVTPKLGAVMCWRRGKAGYADDGAGHVGIVEKIEGDTLTASMSAYGGTRWYLREFKLGSYSYNSLVFQGFIYNPNIAEEKPKKSVDEVAKEVIDGKWGNGTARKKALKEAGYNPTEVQQRVNEIMHADKPLKVGDNVKAILSGKASSNGTGKTARSNIKGTITRIVQGASYPYLLSKNGSAIGWYKANALQRL